jgi:DNA-nicking Smr family endonuclease
LTNNISEKNKKDWINFINSKEKIHNKDEKFYKKPNTKTKILDLHGYTLDDANKTIENFINKAFSENINKLVIITGKGLHSNNEKDPYVSKNLGILKYSVPEYISKNESLMSMINEIVDANIEDGGSGAFYIYLKKNKNI